MYTYKVVYVFAFTLGGSASTVRHPSVVGQWYRSYFYVYTTVAAIL